MKNCIACGMPMKSAEDHAVGDVNKDYCKYCAREDGSMQSYEEKLESFVSFIMKAKNAEENIAREEAVIAMSNLPAWKK